MSNEQAAKKFRVGEAVVIVDYVGCRGGPRVLLTRVAKVGRRWATTDGGGQRRDRFDVSTGALDDGDGNTSGRRRIVRPEVWAAEETERETESRARANQAIAERRKNSAQGALEACVRALVDAVESLAHRAKPTAPAPAPTPFTAERLDQLEKNCLATYMGGHDGEKLEAFQHGMATVFNVLRAGVQAVEKATEERPRIADQPAPVPTSGVPIWDLVIADMKERDRLGRERYGTPLQAGNGRKALVDAYQESLDQCAYLRQEIEERAARGEHTISDSEMVDKLVQAGWVIADGLWFQGQHGRAGYGSTAQAYAVMRGFQVTNAKEPTEAEMAAELRAEGAWRGNSGCWIWSNGEPSGLRTADAYAAMRAAKGRKS